MKAILRSTTTICKKEKAKEREGVIDLIDWVAGN